MALSHHFPLITVFLGHPVVSAPVAVPFLWTLDLGPGFGTWIWDLDLGLGFGTRIWNLNLGLGFGTGLGLDNNNLPWLSSVFKVATDRRPPLVVYKMLGKRFISISAWWLLSFHPSSVLSAGHPRLAVCWNEALPLDATILEMMLLPLVSK